MNILGPWAMLGAAVLVIALYAYRPWEKHQTTKEGHKDGQANPRKAA